MVCVGSLNAGNRMSLSVAPHTDADPFGIMSGSRAVVMMRSIGIAVPDGFEKTARQVFGLTNAEATLARSLISGSSLRQAPDAAGLTFKTGRTYLDRVFAKTGTHRQSELVALLMSCGIPN